LNDRTYSIGYKNICFKILKVNVQKRCRILIKQMYESEDVQKLVDIVSKDHIHLHVKYPPSLVTSDLVKRLNRRNFCRLQVEYPKFIRRFWLGIFGL